MGKIGGNIEGILQKKIALKNAIGETTATDWMDYITHIGFLDFQSGDSKHTNFNAKLQESTHVFISDYFDIKDCKPNNSRFVCDDEVYEILLIDDPMKLHQQIEIYLKFVG